LYPHCKEYSQNLEYEEAKVVSKESCVGLYNSDLLFMQMLSLLTKLSEHCTKLASSKSSANENYKFGMHCP
jgi:hypothetical protein